MINRQAVIIIHGIGEQNPMNTLRDFVIAVAPSIEKSDKPKFYNKPDDLSSLFELRRITSNRHKHSFKTDYFEYYWAHNMRDTKFTDVWWWFIKIMLKKPEDIPKRLRWLYWLFWIILCIALGILISTFINANLKDISDYISDNPFRLIISTALIVTNYFIIKYLGDASRYMTPSPNNIAERQKIRKDGIELLSSLHSATLNGKRKYDRIIVVGHSLGSVIAYDLLNLYWNRIYDRAIHLDTREIENLENKANKLNEEYSKLEKVTSEITKWNREKQLIDQFQRDQFETWIKQNNNNEHSWRISDFITIGSPLAHAPLFLAKNHSSFGEKKIEREYPTCPPINEDGGRFSFEHASGRRIFHHAAPFSLTRWNNLYFENDYIGGAIKDLGYGIKNIRLKSSKLIFKLLPLRSIPFLSHTYYWDESEKDSIKCIRKSLQLIFDKSTTSEEIELTNEHRLSENIN